MRELTCIVCPIGCRLTVDESSDPSADGSDAELVVAGNRCPRGAVYAAEEIRAPKRVLTATCALGAAGACSDGTEALRSRVRRRGMCEPRRLPVKSSLPCPKERLGELLADIYRTRAVPPVRLGDVIIADWKGTGIDVVAARTLD